MTFRKVALWAGAAVLILVVVLYILLLAGLWATQERLMFGRRTHVIVETPEDRGWPYEDVWVEVGHERTHGWWLPVPEARGVVLFSHGSGRNISGYLEDAALFHALDFSVLLYDYGGYGRSTGVPSEARCYADAQAMWRHLVNARGIPPHRILLAGSSMGGGVTCELALRTSPAAVILESSFTSVADALRDTLPGLPARSLLRIQFRNLDKIQHFPCPVLIVHSQDDAVVPFAHGRRLYEHAPAPKMFLEVQGAHYGGKFNSRDIYLAGLQTFITQHVFLGNNTP